MKEFERTYFKKVEESFEKLNNSIAEDRTSIGLGSSVLDAWEKFEELHDETYNHCKRVGNYLMGLPSDVALSPEERTFLHVAGSLHDVGKVADILLIENRLTPSEAELVKHEQHAEVGAWLLQGMNFPSPIVEMVGNHHKKGQYWEHGLDKSTQLLMVADRYDAIQAARMYKPETSHEQAWVKLKGSFGVIFDPSLEESFRKTVSRHFNTNADR